MKRKMYLQLFEDGAGAGSGGQGGNAVTGSGGQGPVGASGAHTGTYTYEQLEEIASARADKSERAALANFFRSQGMTKAVTAAAARAITALIKGVKSMFFLLSCAQIFCFLFRLTGPVRPVIVL